MRLRLRAGPCRWLAVGAALLAYPAAAQITRSATITPAPPSTDPADRLAANLVVLSQNPRDVNALTEAGLSAIAVGDGNAAISFLARAEEISPSNGRIKAALGSALLLLEKPTDALRLFAEAITLGMPEQKIARDRGLAYDLRGDPKRAQRDYALALRGGADDEVTLRYALSLGISGDRDRALETLEPLLRGNNMMASRARAFILAMNNDLIGAESVASATMPGGAGASMSPFLRRLATLNPAERALAVNFGIMPSDGKRYAMVQTGDPYRSGSGASDALIPAGDPFGPRDGDDAEQQPRKAAPVSKEPRRRPGRERVTLTASRDRSDEGEARPGFGNDADDDADARVVPATRPLIEPVSKRIGPVVPEKLPPQVQAILDRKTGVPGGSETERRIDERPVQVVVLKGATSLPAPVRTPPGGGALVPSVTLPATTAAASPKPAPSAEQPKPVFEVPLSPPATQIGAVGGPQAPPSGVQTVVRSAPPPVPLVPLAAGSQTVPQTVPQPAPMTQPVNTAAPVADGPGLGSILVGLQTEEESAAGPLPTATQIKAARLAAQKKAAADLKVAADAKAAKDAKEAERQLAAKSPARIWVQVATGANEAGLPSTWKKLKEKSPATFKGLSASSVPFKATNRLLVGPFKSQAEARALVNAMGKAGMQGNTFNSEAGQEIAKVAAK